MIYMYIYIYTRIHISVYIVKFTYHCMYPITWQCYYYMIIKMYIYISKYVVIQRLHLGLCRVCTLHFDARNLQDSGDGLSGAERWGVWQSPATESTEKLRDVYMNRIIDISIEIFYIMIYHILYFIYYIWYISYFDVLYVSILCFCI